MPHKRAKKSVREKNKSERGSDLAPAKQSLAKEAIPKSAARILNAAQIRADWKEKKRKSEHLDADSSSSPKTKRRKTESTKMLGIQPGESLQHFNKRVENDMRPLVRDATKSSLAVTRNAAKPKPTKTSGPPNTEPPPPDKHANRPKEFQSLSSSAPRRLNDIAQAPPEFKKPPGKVKDQSTKTTARRHEGVVSMAQKLRMEEEREKAIQRYRQLKADRLGEKNLLQD